MNYRNTLIAAAAAAAAASFAGNSLATEQDQAGTSGQGFDALDTNRDGRVSRAEASADSSIVFARADSNGDGYIDAMEYGEARKMNEGDSSPSQTMPQSTDPATPDTTQPV